MAGLAGPHCWLVVSMTSGEMAICVLLFWAGSGVWLIFIFGIEVKKGE